MNTLAILLFGVSVGYVAAAFTWDKVHAWIIGAEAKAAQLRHKAAALVAKVRGL